MRTVVCLLAGWLLLSGPNFAQDMKKGSSHLPVLVIHGGAGNIRKEHLSAEEEVQYREKLQKALETGYAILEEGGSSLDAVEAAIRTLEDSPLFNAGKGAVYTHEEKNEMDASIMDGRTKQAGAVAGVTTIRNPVSGARKVLEASEHVMLSGEGADAFAEEQGVETVEPSYFGTERRLEHLRKIQKKDKSQLDHDAEEGGDGAVIDPGQKFGTVGAVALDKEGNLAAATSTGGMTNKKYGRIGDSPIIGAGTYADNNTCAVSCTGHGEYFIRNVVAYDVSALMTYQGMSLSEATDTVIQQKLKDLGGSGGLIAVDKDGRISVTFNTAGMFRGSMKDGKSHIGIFGTD